MKYLILLLFPISVFATPLHFLIPYDAAQKPTETVIETRTIETKVIERVIEKSSGIALGIAYSQLQFDKNISGLQFGIGGGFYDTQSAIAFGLAKQIKEKTILNISVGSEGKKSSVGIGLNFTLK